MIGSRNSMEDFQEHERLVTSPQTSPFLPAACRRLSTTETQSGFEILDYDPTRRSGIGASDAATVLGESKYKSPFTLWGEMTGKIQPDDLSDNEAVQFGTKLEGIVLGELAERTGRVVTGWPQNRSMKSVRWPFMRCKPDATEWPVDAEGVTQEIGHAQAKTTGMHLLSSWENEPPLPHMIQLQHELAVSGATWGTLCVLAGIDMSCRRMLLRIVDRVDISVIAEAVRHLLDTGKAEFRWFDFTRNDAFIEALVAKEEEFWDCVQRDVMPPIDGSESTTEALKKLYPKDSGGTVYLGSEFDAHSEELVSVKLSIKELEEREKWLKNQFRAAIHEASEAILTNGSRYTYRVKNNKGSVTEPYSYRKLRKQK